jgi:hypothetical protein
VTAPTTPRRAGEVGESAPGGAAAENPWTHSIFQQHWWLDAVAPGSWGESKVEKDGEVVGALPYMVKRRYGLRVLSQPPLMSTLGPWLKPFEGKESRRAHVEKEVLGELIAQLPRFDLFHQQLPPAITNWLPFYWAGFSATTHYTYQLSGLSDHDAVWHGFNENARRQIRKAEKQLAVRTDLDLVTFFKINAETFERRGVPVPYPFDALSRLDRACDERRARRIFFAVDAKDQVVASVYLVWDRNAAYYLMAGFREGGSGGAASLLVWEALKFASTVVDTFDFQGSMIESIERFFRGFGAAQVPFFFVSNASRRMRVLREGQEIARAFRRAPARG